MRSINFSRALLLASTMTLLLPTAAYAQSEDMASETTTPPPSNDDIIVTATKREQTLQDTPVAVSVTSAETLERAQVRDVAALQSLVPSLRVENSSASGATTFYIRGFGNGGTNPGIEPSVGVFIDGVYRSRAAAAISDFPDVQRIEVLRGPQSTLFGKNASAGVISVTTQLPKYEFGGMADFTYGNYNTMIGRARITGPISDKMAFSLAGGFNRHDGYAKDPNLGRSNERNRWYVRGQLLIEPTDALRIRLIGDYDKIDESCCIAGVVTNGPTAAVIKALGGEVSPHPFTRQFRYSYLPQNKIENYGFSGQIDLDVGPGTLTSITSYRRSRNQYDSDSDYTSADILEQNVADFRIRTITQELRYATDLDGPVNFLVGGYYFNERVAIHEDVRYGSDWRPYLNALLAPAGLTANRLEAILGRPQGSLFQAGGGIIDDYRLRNQAYSLFGQVDFDVTDRLRLTGGLSYTNDKKQLSGTGTTTDIFGTIVLPAALAGLKSLQTAPPFQNFPNAVEDGRFNGDKFTYLARAAYEVTDTLNVYASYATGYKASSVNLSRDSRPTAADRLQLISLGLAVPNLTSGSRGVAPENSRVMELGIKGQWKVAGFNFALFDQAIKGFQSNVFAGTGFLMANAGKQSAQGFEFEGWVRPVDGLVVNGAITYIDSVYDSFTNSIVGDISGRRPAGTPPISATASAAYTHNFGNGNELIFSGDYHYESETQINEQYRNLERTINEFNAAITFKMDMGLEMSVWGRNLTKDNYLVQVFPGVAQAGTIMGYANNPRTYGATVRYRF